MFYLPGRAVPLWFYRQVSNKGFSAITLAVFTSFSLLLSTFVIARTSPGSGLAQSRRGNPQAGPPAATLPNLDEVRRARQRRPKAPPPVPSTVRGPRKPIEPRNGRKVGDPGTISFTGSAFTQTISLPAAHARASDSSDKIEAGKDSGLADAFTASQSSTPTKPPRWRPRTSGVSGPGSQGLKAKSNHVLRTRGALSPLPIGDDQYLQTFFSYALMRTPNSTEQAYWDDILRAAYAHGQPSMVMAARELGKTLFESADYAARNRSNHDYVYDLYEAYLLRYPDEGGWAFWESQIPAMGREGVRRAFDECPEFISDVATVTPNGGASSAVSSLASARDDANNQSGNQIMARDAEWSVPLLSLPGRAGLDLGLTLSYSSAATWTRAGPYLYFDEDNGWLSPGFHLGFATIQERFFDAQVGANVYVLIMAAGSRVELRQVGTSATYEAADSSYLQLTDNGSSLLLRATDGSQMSYSKLNNEWRCIQIKDRNGNFLTVNYNSLGDITSIVDTLARTITFNYDGNANLLSITQTWHRDLLGGGQTTETHTWASFGWTTTTIQPNFSGALITGVANGQSLPVLAMVGLDDGSYYKFAYTNWNSGQVARITHYASDSNPALDNHERAHIAFDYLAADDSTRLTAARLAAENWTGINGVPSEVTTQFTREGSACTATVVGEPNSTTYKEFYGTGWQSRLPIQSEIWSGGVRQKWTTTAWTQDNTSVSYQFNPRITETNIYDAAGNRSRTSIDYFASFGLPSTVTEYGADGSTPIRFTVHGYKNDDVFLSRRIIGLPYQDYIFDGNWQLYSKTSYEYDWRDGYMSTQAPSMQHDTTNYGANFDLGRGILVAVRRWNVNAPDDPNQAIWVMQEGYNLTG
ncbi:MAG TPA: DUF4214 domain-containing protein, partial [Pyrinomonadaceae bacterium]